MKRRQQTRESLCFCEYEDIKGERSHILAACCNCEAVDSLCDSLLRCQSVPEEKIIDAIETIEDRMRIPFCNGRGAIRVNLDIALPLISFAVFLSLGACGFYWTVFSFVSFVGFIFFTHRLRRYKLQSKFFYICSLTWSIGLLIVYLIIVVGFRKVLLWETMLLLTLFALTTLFFYLTKQDPGHLESEKGRYQQPHPHEYEGERLDEYQVTWVDSRPIEDGVLQLQCSTCNVRRPPRSGHCPRCERCVLGRDHHCEWLDTCIGHYNHRSFFAFLVTSLLTGVYGAHLTTTTICTPEIYLNWFLWPSDCRFLYSDFPTGLCVSSVCFASLFIIHIILVLIEQIIYISQNVTSQEMNKARRRGFVRWCGYVAINNVNNRGFVTNWIDFLTYRRRQKYLESVTFA